MRLLSQFTDTGLLYESLQPLTLAALSPSAGPIVGGTSVHILGGKWSLRMASLSTLSCRFNSTVVPALHISDIEVRCTSPTSPAGLVVVEASNDGQQFTYAGNLRFTYVHMELISLNPSQGPPEGGTVISIYGQGLGLPASDDTALQKSFCVFEDGTEALATHWSTHLLTCASPTRTISMHRSIRVRQNGAYLTGNLLFRYSLPHSIAVGPHRPQMGPVEGGTLISFTMTDLNIFDQASCIFGQVFSASACQHRVRWPNSECCRLSIIAGSNCPVRGETELELCKIPLHSPSQPNCQIIAGDFEHRREEHLGRYS